MITGGERVHPLGLAPSVIIAVHLNYRSRAAERGRTPDAPSYFLKPPSSLSSSGVPLVRPDGCELMGYEGEIAVIIGRTGRSIPVERAREHIGWYAAANDAGVYDLRAADRGSNVRSKGQDGFTPVGPTLIDAREVDPESLVLRTWVNGRLVQQADHSDMIFDLETLVADLSRTMTLRRGDIILTGTPTGAGLVEPGDLVEVEVSGGGRLSNRIEAGPALAAPGALPLADTAAREVAGVLARDIGSPQPLPATEPPLPAGRPDGLRHDVAEALGSVSTATVFSQLRKRGINECYLQGLRPTRPGSRMLGRARTLRYGALREDVFARIGGGMNAQKRAVEDLGAGDVLVIECRGEPGAGTIGDILAMRAKVRGAAGVVTDGALRDTPEFAELELPVYYGGSHAAVLGRRHVPLDTDLPVTCGGVLVFPGDVLVGDDEGVVVIPVDLVDDVAAGALGQEQEETWILEQVRNGAEIAGLYPMSAQTRTRYEAERSQGAQHDAG